MNLWTAEQTVRAVIKESNPAIEQSLNQEQLESLVEAQATQLLEEIQQIQDLNRGRSLDPEEILEVAKQTALKHLQERVAAGLKSRRRIAPRPRSELSPEERNFTIEPGFEPQPAGRRKRLEANLEAIRLLKVLELEDRLATPEEKQVLAKYNGFGADKEVFNSSMAQYRTFANRDSYDFYAGRKVYELKAGLDAETLYAQLRPVLTGVSVVEICSAL